LKVILHKVKKKYYLDKLKTLSGNLRSTWHLLGTVIKSKPLPNIFDSYIQNGRVITDKTEIVNKCNQYFVDIGSDLASKIPPTKVNISTYLKGNFSSSFSLCCLTRWLESWLRRLTSHQHKMSSQLGFSRNLLALCPH